MFKNDSVQSSFLWFIIIRSKYNGTLFVFSDIDNFRRISTFSMYFSQSINKFRWDIQHLIHEIITTQHIKSQYFCDDSAVHVINVIYI